MLAQQVTTQSNTNAKWHWLDTSLCLLLFAAAVAIGLAATAAGPGVNPDAASYISMATNLLKGRGFVANMAEFYDPTPWRPVTLWPPAYPLLVAALVSFGVEGMEAARLVSILSFGALVGAIYWLGHIIGDRTVALPAAIATLVLAPIVRTASFALTETTFMVASVFAIGGMVLFVKSDPSRRFRWVVFSGIFTAIALLVRYVGGVWLLAGLLVIFATLRSDWKKWLGYSFTFGSISVLPILPWFARNMLLVGFVSGMDRGDASHPTFAENIRLVMTTLAGELIPSVHLGLRDIVNSTPIYIWLLAAILGLAVLYLFWRIGIYSSLRNGLQHEIVAMRQGNSPILLWLVIAVNALGYFAAIFYLSNTSKFPAYDWPRYLAPIYPLILLSGTFFVAILLKQFTPKWPNWAQAAVVMAVSLLWIVPYGIQTRGFVDQAALGQEYTRTEWRQNEAIQNLSGLIAEEDIIYTDNPHAVSFLLDRAVVSLPRIEELDQFNQYLDEQIGASKSDKYIIVFKGDLSYADPYRSARLLAPDVAALANQRSDIYLLADFEDGAIYQFEQALSQD